jgi:ribonuclease J
MPGNVTRDQDLVAPPSEGAIRIVPLGGLGEIGMNCLALEHAQGILVVDCGVTFPDDDVGIDTYHPDLSFLLERRERVVGVFLTHGHEDHVGALPYLLKDLDVPVWGPPHALAVARHRITERQLTPRLPRMLASTPRTRVTVGPFEIEPIRVTHSITDATALAIRTDAGLLLHTGDFKFDPAPPDGELTDEARLSELGDEGVRLLLSDSTNIDARSEPGSESVVGETLEELCRRAPARVVIGMFASNIQRLRMIGEFAQRLGRRVALFGRSIDQSVQWGRELGRLSWPSDLVIAREQAANVRPSDLLVLAGGTQAEPGSALMNLAAGTHPLLKLTREDTVVFSSRIIPGNDRPVFAMMGEFLRAGVTVKNWITDPGVHVSGHAHRVEQKKMLELARPRSFVPLHGTRHHLERHAELAKECGVGEVLVLENGEVGLVNGSGLVRGGRVATGRVATWDSKVLPPTVLRERRLLSRGGALHVSVTVDGRGKPAGRPVVWARGVIDSEQDPASLRFVALEVVKALEERSRASRTPDDETIAETARIAARRAVEAKTGRKPVCLATVIRV